MNKMETKQNKDGIWIAEEVFLNLNHTAEGDTEQQAIDGLIAFKEHTSTVLKGIPYVYPLNSGLE
jgi:hypothetical protein|tara:strand:- start:411 stop:605 length:195 start_codon:yes stop_codon:yes gene_type:complete